MMADGPRDLRSFLLEHRAATWHLPAGLDTRYDLTALQHALDRQRHFPILRAERMLTADGGTARLAVITNLTASRKLCARALGVGDHREMAAWYATRSAAGIAPRIVARDSAPVQQHVMQGAQADLRVLPVLTQHELEPGPYLTAAHATTYDPDSLVDNTAIQRCWVQAAQRMSWFPYPSSHNARNLAKFWRRDEACPVAFWIGHHPAVLMGTQAKLRYPESHWMAAGGVLGEPLRLVPSITHGERIMVPADAEIVIEGWAQPNQLAPDGPFGEYTGYLGPAVQAPICEVTCISMREDALYHDYGSGLTDMLVPDNLAMEGKLFQLAKAVAPSLRNVHVPTAGRRFHARLQLEQPSRGEARDALTAALAYRRTKLALAVDTDVDIFDDESVEWAVATRVQWSRDSFVIDALSGSSLDPSLDAGENTASKIAIDATRAVPTRANAPPVATAPAQNAARANAYLARADSAAWPRA